MILQVLASLDAEAAGPSYSVPRLARALTADGCKVQLMSTGTAEGANEVLGVPHRRYTRTFKGLGRLDKLCVSSDLRKVLAEYSGLNDIIHTHGLWRMPNIYPSTAALKGEHKVVLSPRGMLSPRALAYSKYTKSLFWYVCQNAAVKRVDMFHATSEQEFEDIRSYGLSQPVAVIPNGIDVPEQAVAKPSRLRRILFLGRIHPIKQVELLIDAWARLEADHSDWVLEIRGPGEESYISRIQQYIQKRGISRCAFGPPLYGPEKFKAFQQASLFVLPSASENFGMTIAESLASGTPVIATKGAPWSGLSENRCGWWIDQGLDPLVTALNNALALPEHSLAQMGERGRSWMLRDFSWCSIGRDMSRAYHWIRFGGDRPSYIRT